MVLKYTYELNHVERPLKGLYYREELEQLTTLQLREVCLKEKLVIGVAYKLDRKYIIETILKYRGAKLFTFINTLNEESFQRVQNIFVKYLNFIVEDKKIFVPVKLMLYKNTSLDFTDDYYAEGTGLDNGNILLLDDKKQIIGILNLKLFNGKYYIISNCDLLTNELEKALYRNYYLGFLNDAGSRYLYNFYYQTEKVRPTRMKCILKPIKELLITELNENANTLLIDFGTSNTSLGSYIDEHNIPLTIQHELSSNGINLNQTNIIKFYDSSVKNYNENLTFPTVISIKDCKDRNNIEYRFGFDALKETKKHSYNYSQSVFYGFKKWVNNYKKEEEVSDENGNIAVISRKEMLRAYFIYLINTSQQQHKCIYKKIHITSPVKQKVQFLEMYKDILHDYEVEEKSSIDEGIAVLYNSISNQIEGQKFDEDFDYNALIIDCGGGTTDLSSCTYYIEDNQITYNLNMTTTYANGETNFGGNNITFRIFQYLKILFSSYYRDKKNLTFDDILNMDYLDIYRFVDDYGIDEVYKNLNDMYDKAEKVIPTKFFYYKNSPSEDYMKIKSNFYFLWNLAEKIKVNFYESVGVTQTNFHNVGIKEDIRDVKIFPEESWRINVITKKTKMIRTRNDKEDLVSLELITDYPQIIITKDEINNLIKADIYNVIKKFLEPLYYDDKLSNLNSIKLTGQTCKIDIFREALKEFIAGRIIQSSKKNKTIRDYKLVCLEGAVKYLNSKRIGLIAPSITNESPITPYKLLAYTHSGNEVIMMSSLEKITKSYGFISRNIETETIELRLNDAENKTLHKYSVDIRFDNLELSSYEETSDRYSDKILQDDIDNIIDNEIKIFTFAYKDKWGFYTLPIARKDGSLYLGKQIYLPFENDEWELNFFDGKK